MTESTNSRWPENIGRIHLIAVCGTGMGALACMLKESGYEVTGSDQNVYPPMSRFLQEKGIDVTRGFSGDNLALRPDLVVVGNAVSKTNPEVEAMMELGLAYCSMPQALNHLVAAGKKPIVITGTHGKTTTAALIAHLLVQAGLDPTFMIGGILKNFDSNYRLGKGEYFVVEGDEYDTAFFDKGPKFLHYRPHAAVLTSVEFDHADIFADLDHVKAAFRQFVAGLPPTCRLVAFDGDHSVQDLIRNSPCRVESYGQQPGSHWRMDNIEVQPPRTTFEVFKTNGPFKRFRSPLMGDHNLRNTLAAIAVADCLNIPADGIEAALASFAGIRRRQEIRGVRNGITVMDDFAHHPTAVRETIRAVRPFFRPGRVVAVFEPRTNSSMRDVFQETYAQSFDAADLVCIRRPPLLEKIPPEQRFSSEKLVADLTDRGKKAHFFPDTDTIIGFLRAEARSGDLILVMSNGGFDNIHERLLEQLQAPAPVQRRV
ncbi:MAG: Mur ligase [Deltaproteobacteria bacterium SG8_13]|nr:MAG: Mur ligase [Deltaproteobacteria bacterium SG8_13]